MSRSGITNTARRFLQQTDISEPETLFRLYAEYLLSSSQALQLPVPLHQIRECHSLRRHTAPMEQRGFLFGGSEIFINTDDLDTVQRFTEAHEMMETLFIALESEVPSRFSSDVQQKFLKNKENLCNQGAAELLMPAALFFPLVEENGVKFNSGSKLATLCRTSLTATIRRMLSADIAPCIFGYLKTECSKEQQNSTKIGQGLIPSFKLKVWKLWKSPQTNASIYPSEVFARNSTMSQTLRANTLGKTTYGYDKFSFKEIEGMYKTESMLVTINGTLVVMTLIHL